MSQLYDTIYDALDTELAGTYPEEVMSRYFPNYDFNFFGTASKCTKELTQLGVDAVENGELSLLQLLGKEEIPKEETLEDVKAERDRFLAIAYKAITLGQLDEQYSEKALLHELGCTKAEFDKIMN